MRKTVWCETSFIGFHAWPAAPPIVDYLSKQHRHLFKVRVEVVVEHDDRQVEFHCLKRNVDAVIQEFKDLVFEGSIVIGKNMGADSCEIIAMRILDAIGDIYIVHAITVSEDGECGATIQFD